MSPIAKIARAFDKPPGVVAYRAAQEARILAAHVSGQFRRETARAAKQWAVGGAALNALLQAPPVLLHASALAADRGLWAGQPAAVAAARAIVQRNEEAGVLLFADRVRIDGAIDWHRDWRTGYVYPQQFFKHYDHYGDPGRPRDVKRPWELNRLAFLVPMAATAFIARDRRLADRVDAVLADWDAHNPYGYTVAWYPMEASMRIMQLVVLLDLARGLVRDGLSDAALVARLARLIALHGRFVALTLEYTDVRGNHYMANIAALVAAGKALGSVDRRAWRWAETGARLLASEVPLQILPDGVNFEKSLPYHRLVAELIAVAVRALARPPEAIALPAEVMRRHAAGIEVLAAVRRADGLVPNWGDNDDAKALNFDDLPSRQIDSLALLEGHGGDWPDIAPASLLSALWLNGAAPLRAAAPVSGLRHFEAGGLVVARAGTAGLFVDVGEVGLQGRGGHGHNDLTSFELCLGGSVVIVDPGCAVYTGDQPLRNRFRSTRAHNVMMVDEREMAAMTGLWRIADTARPTEVSAQETAEGVEVRVGHTGYADQLLRYVRMFTLPRDGTGLLVSDTLEPRQAVEAVWRFHLAAGLEVVREQPHVAVVQRDGRRIARLIGPHDIFWQIEAVPLSAGYGHVTDTACLSARLAVDKPATVAFRIEA